MMQCPDCNGFLKIVDYSEYERAVQHVKGNNRCRADTCREAQMLLHGTGRVYVSKLTGKETIIPLNAPVPHDTNLVMRIFHMFNGALDEEA